MPTSNLEVPLVGRTRHPPHPHVRSQAPSAWRGGIGREPQRRRVIYLGNAGPPMLAFARGCHAAGWDVHLLDVDGEPGAWASYSRCLEGGRPFPSHLLEKPGGIRELVEFVAGIGAQALIALKDEHQQWLAANRAAFEPLCHVLVPDLAVLDLLGSKKAQVGLARRAGFDVLATWYLTARTRAADIPRDRFPLVLRPDHNRAIRPDFKVEYVAAPHDLDRILRSHRFLGEAPLIAQPFRDLPNLLVHGIRSTRGEILALEGFLVTRKFQGLSMTVQKYELSPDLKRCCYNFAALANLSSCFHFDLLHDPAESKSYYLEINARLGGTTDKVTRLGFPEGVLTLAAHGLAAAPVVGMFGPERIVNKRQVLKHAVHALTRNFSPLDYPGGSRLLHLFRSLRDLAMTRDSIFSWDDIRGSLWFHLRKRSKC